MNSPQVLLIDDEAQMRKLLDITLQSNNYKVIQACNAKEGLVKAANHPPDLILLDIGLPDKNGHEVLKSLREWYKSPVIIISVHNAEEDIVQALDEGANDYLVKPFRTGELLARLRAALRRSGGDTKDSIIDCGDLQIDLDARMVKKGDELIKLTSTEYSLLILLAENDGRVLTHKYILKTVWGPSFSLETQYLRVFIAQLRKKIEHNANSPKYITTEAGVGYRFMAKE